jgi:hypothetical protein
VPVSGTGLKGGIYHRTIAGASAEISNERIHYRGTVRRVSALEQRKKGHHDAGRAEAALAAMKGHQCALYRV